VIKSKQINILFTSKKNYPKENSPKASSLLKQLQLCIIFLSGKNIIRVIRHRILTYFINAQK
jgi:hypothetical protein